MFGSPTRGLKELEDITYNKDGLLDYRLEDICNALRSGKKGLKDFGVNSLKELKEKLSEVCFKGGNKIWSGQVFEYYSTARASKLEPKFSTKGLDKILRKIEERDARGDTAGALRLCFQYYSLGTESVMLLEEFLGAADIDKKESKLADEDVSISPDSDFEDQVIMEKTFVNTLKCLGGEVRKEAEEYIVRARIIPTYSKIKENFKGTSFFKGIKNLCRTVKDNLKTRAGIKELISVGREAGINIFPDRSVVRALPAIVATGVMIGASALSVISEKKVEINKISSGENYEIQNLSTDTRANSGDGGYLELSQDYLAWKTQNSYILTNGGGDYEIKVYKISSDKTSLVSAGSSEDGVEIEFDLWGDKIVYSDGNYFNYYNCSAKKLSKTLDIQNEYYKFKDLWLVDNDLLFTGCNRTTQNYEILHYDFLTDKCKSIHSDSSINFLRFSGKYFSYVDSKNIMDIFRLTGAKIQSIPIEKFYDCSNFIHLSNNYAIYPFNDKLFSFKFSSKVNKDIGAQRKVYDSYNNYLALGSTDGAPVGELSVLDLDSGKEYVENEYVKGEQVRDASIFGEKIAYNSELDATIHVVPISDFTPSETSAPPQQPSTPSTPSQSSDIHLVHLTDLHVRANLMGYDLGSYFNQIELFNPQPTAVLVTGDLVDWVGGASGKANLEKLVSYLELKNGKIFIKGTNIEFICEVGNHDFYDGVSYPVHAYDSQTYKLVDVLVNKLLLSNIGPNTYNSNPLLPDVSLSKVDFVKEIGNLAIIGLCTGGDIAPKIYGSGGLSYVQYGDIENGILPEQEGFSNAQMTDLETKLKSIEEENLIVMQHAPLYGASDGSIAQNKEKCLNLFKQYGVDVDISGHTHEYNKVVKDGTVFVTGAATCKAGYINITVNEKGITVGPQEFFRSQDNIQMDCPAVLGIEIQGKYVGPDKGTFRNEIPSVGYSVIKRGDNDFVSEISVPAGLEFRLRVEGTQNGKVNISGKNNQAGERFSITNWPLAGKEVNYFTINNGKIIKIEQDKNGDGTIDAQKSLYGTSISGLDKLVYTDLNHPESNGPSKDTTSGKIMIYGGLSVIALIGIYSIAKAADYYSTSRRKERESEETQESNEPHYKQNCKEQESDESYFWKNMDSLRSKVKDRYVSDKWLSKPQPSDSSVGYDPQGSADEDRFVSSSPYENRSFSKKFETSLSEDELEPLEDMSEAIIGMRPQPPVWEEGTYSLTELEIPHSREVIHASSVRSGRYGL